MENKFQLDFIQPLYMTPSPNPRFCKEMSAYLTGRPGELFTAPSVVFETNNVKKSKSVPSELFVG